MDRCILLRPGQYLDCRECLFPDDKETMITGAWQTQRSSLSLVYASRLVPFHTMTIEQDWHNET